MRVLNAAERKKLMSLDQRTERIAGPCTAIIKPGEVAIDCRPRPDYGKFRRYLWRGPISGKLYRLDVESSPNR